MRANKIACSILERSFAAYSFGAEEVAAARAVGRARAVGWGTVVPGSEMAPVPQVPRAGQMEQGAKRAAWHGQREIWTRCVSLSQSPPQPPQ